MFVQLADDLRFDLFHVRYNAAHRGAETDVFNRLPDDDCPGIVAYTATRWGDLLNPRKMPAGEKPLSATDCYRFVMSHQPVDVCMSGPKNIEEMRQALKAVQLGPLSGDELKRIQRIGDKGIKIFFIYLPKPTSSLDRWRRLLISDRSEPFLR